MMLGLNQCCSMQDKSFINPLLSLMSILLEVVWRIIIKAFSLEIDCQGLNLIFYLSCILGLLVE